MITMGNPIVCLALALCARGAGPLSAEPSADFAIRAAEVWTDAGSIGPGVVVVRGGDIASVGPAAEVALPEGLHVIEHDGAVSAGLIACRAFPSFVRDTSDPTRTALAEAHVADAVAPAHEDFAILREAGITSVVVTPSSGNFVGGQTAVFKTDGSELRPNAHLAVSLAAATFNTRRRPTSVAGAVAELGAALEARQGVWADVADMKMPIFLEVRDRNEVQRALQLVQTYKIGGAIYGASEAGELADQLRTSRLGIVSAPFAIGQSQREIDALLRLAEAQVPLAFGLDLPLVHPSALRWSAALCVRAGMPPEAAWRALTLDAARIAGVAARAGRLAAGLDADLVLWSGSPLDLRSSVEAVFIDGRRVATRGEE